MMGNYHVRFGKRYKISNKMDTVCLVHPIVIEAVSVNKFITYALSDIDSYRDLISGKFQGDNPIISDNRIFEILEARDFGASEGHNCV